jgi:hypothetical protein
MATTKPERKTSAGRWPGGAESRRRYAQDFSRARYRKAERIDDLVPDEATGVGRPPELASFRA